MLTMAARPTVPGGHRVRGLRSSDFCSNSPSRSLGPTQRVSHPRKTLVQCSAPFHSRQSGEADRWSPSRKALQLGEGSAGIVRGRVATQAVLEAKEAATGKQLVVGWAAEQGLRAEMEDEVVVVEDVPGGFILAGVFDGHSGHTASRFLKDELHSECLAALEKDKLLEKEFEGEHSSLVSEALSDAFARTDERLLQRQEENAEESEQNAGSTATVCIVRHDKIALAHVGDSRAVMAAGGYAHELSEDHRVAGDSPMALSEKQRINDVGGWVAGGRVCGLLAVSRAFGNGMYKSKTREMLEEGLLRGRWTKRFIDKRKTDQAWVTARPEVYCAPLPGDVEFIILGSDGLWDAVKGSEAVKFVRTQLEEHEDVQQAVTALVKYALDERKGDDNISVVLIKVK